MSLIQNAALILLLPLAAFAFLAFLHKRIWRHGDWIATGVIGVCFLLALRIFFAAATSDDKVFLAHWTFDWLPVTGKVTMPGGILVDGLTAVMLVVVTLVSFLVHLFSSQYLKGDVRYGRYYCSLLLFTFSMLGLILSDNLLYLFVFWELVGLSSYVLIGHWYEKKSASNAAIKAFITTRVGDIGMLIGLLICYWRVGSFQYVDLFAAAQENLFNKDAGGIDWQFWASIGLFFGAMGKSAQFPLHVWLPDAMEGPTPVSALIHAATMVAAGVYLVGRLFPLFTPESFLFVAYIGGVTALFAASIALVQDDIKKVLAYSTLSQLGFMMLSLGVGGTIAGGYHAGLFHLTTHAFFKAGLFLGSGSVIHAMHHEQSLSKYGGLWKKLPITGTTYFICVLAIIGCPPFAGFFSKDAILGSALEFAQANPKHWFLGFTGFFSAFLTAFYMFRQFFLTFTGKPRDKHAYDHAHESPWQMTVPLIILAFLAVVSGWGGWFKHISPPSDGKALIQAYAAHHEAMKTPLTSPIVVAALAHAGHGDAHASEAAHGDGHAAEAGHGEEAHAEGHGGHHGSAHAIAMILSILVAALGVSLAWAMYFERGGRTMISPALVVRRVRPLHILLLRKYYFDEFYGLLVLFTTRVLIVVMAWFDNNVIDRIVRSFGTLGKVLAWLTAIADYWIVDGAVRGTGELAMWSGDRLSYTATGKIRHYLLFIALGVVAISILLSIILTLAR